MIMCICCLCTQTILSFCVTKYVHTTCAYVVLEFAFAHRLSSIRRFLTNLSTFVTTSQTITSQTLYYSRCSIANHSSWCKKNLKEKLESESASSLPTNCHHYGKIICNWHQRKLYSIRYTYQLCHN